VTAAWLCLALAVVLAAGRSGADPGGPGEVERTATANLPLALDLTAVALRAGQPLERALLAAAPAAGESAGGLVTVARLLGLGADPADAWAAVAEHDALAGVAAAARRSAHSGIRVAAAFENLAAELRARSADAGRARAHKAGVLAAAPLGLCFLPAFVCLAIVPTLGGLAATVLR
jgi:Flp pilus assembly protein TadB